MAAETRDDLTLRVERLERSNGRLKLMCAASLALPIIAIAGWQDARPSVPDMLRVRKLEVVDSKGVPMVTLGTGRNSEGGTVTLRDKNGERRAWWTASPEGSNLALMKEKDPSMDGSNTAGLSVSQSSAEMNLIGPKNGMLSATVRDDQPRLDLWSPKGASLFAAPWRKK
ncbi:MAG: hypothetical protein QOJ65_2351 [Fimbriimonadaceae bacterium]|jgi:hypothetical protein|nr:hypothetical protein [Fimbriimonadaceae bacterium]